MGGRRGGKKDILWGQIRSENVLEWKTRREERGEEENEETFQKG